MYDSVEHIKPETEVEWKPTKAEWFIMASLAVISLMVALDATILVAVLPVSIIQPFRAKPSRSSSPLSD